MKSSFSSISKVHYLITHTIPHHTTIHPFPDCFICIFHIENVILNWMKWQLSATRETAKFCFRERSLQLPWWRKDDHTMPQFISFTMNVSKHWIWTYIILTSCVYSNRFTCKRIAEESFNAIYYLAFLEFVIMFHTFLVWNILMEVSVNVSPFQVEITLCTIQQLLRFSLLW